MPSGSARSSSALAERKPAAAAYVAVLLQNSLLEIADIGGLRGELKIDTKALLEFPSGSTFRAYEPLCGIGVSNFHARAIPVESLSHPSCDISQEQGLGNHARKFEIPTGLNFASLAGIE